MDRESKKDLKVSRKMDRWIRAIGGTLIIISIGLGHYVSPWWLLMALYVGVMFLQSAFTTWCPMEDLLDSLGVAKKNRRNKHFMKDRPPRQKKSGEPNVEEASPCGGLEGQEGVINS